MQQRLGVILQIKKNTPMRRAGGVGERGKLGGGKWVYAHISSRMYARIRIDLRSVIRAVSTLQELGRGRIWGL